MNKGDSIYTKWIPGDDKRGFTLLEIALFIAIAAVGFITIITILSSTAGKSAEAQIRDTMINLAQERMDVVRAAGFDYALNFQNTSENSISDFPYYTRRTRVHYLSENLADSSGTETPFIRIVVTVSHPEQADVTLSAFITSLGQLR